MSLLPPRKPRVPVKIRPKKAERVMWLRYKRQQLLRMIGELEREVFDADRELKQLGYFAASLPSKENK